MYLKKITLKNVKSFTDLTLDFTLGTGVHLWTALLGQNGLGKSTLLQAIGVVLAGPSAVRELLPVAEGWVRRGEPYGEIEAELLWTEWDALIAGWPKTKSPCIARYIVTGDDHELLPEILSERYTVPTVVDWSGEGTSKERESVTKDMNRLKGTLYAEGKPGWLACGYGPFRRLSGGGQATDRILYAERKSARFITLFREDAALTNAIGWLIGLYNLARDGDKASQRALEQVKDAFADKFFPQPARLDISARGALLEVGGQKPVPLQDLSDGYRSMLALGIDLLRWATAAFPDEDNPMDCPGIVLIDELDAHVHPTWQREIGHWLRQKFPKIQFVVATHSPFLAQVAGPNGNVVLEQTSRGVKPRTDVEFVDAWRTDQILTELFDLPSTRSPGAERKLHSLQDLHHKYQAGQLSSTEEQEYKQLSLWQQSLPPAIEDPAQRRLAQKLQKAVEGQAERLRELT